LRRDIQVKKKYINRKIKMTTKKKTKAEQVKEINGLGVEVETKFNELKLRYQKNLVDGPHNSTKLAENLSITYPHIHFFIGYKEGIETITAIPIFTKQNVDSTFSQSGLDWQRDKYQKILDYTEEYWPEFNVLQAYANGFDKAIYTRGDLERLEKENKELRKKADHFGNWPRNPGVYWMGY